MKDTPKTELFNTFAIKGMDLRDYFAAKAMQSLIADREYDGEMASLTKLSYKYADLMIKERE